MHKKQQDRKKRKSFVPELFERYFRRNEGTTDYATIPEVTLGGVFDILIDSYPSSTASQHMLFGNNASSSFLEINSLGRVRFRALGVADVVSADGVINLNIFQAIRIISAAGQIEIFVDGVSVATMAGTPTTGVYIERLYARGDGNNFSGILANLKIYDNGTLIRDYPLDDNSDILRNRATVLRAELWANPTLGAGWTDNNDGSYTLAGDGSFQQISILDNQVGKTYLINFDYVTDGNIGVRVDSSTVGISPQFYPAGSGRASLLVTANDAGDTTIGLARFNSGVAINATVSNVSIRQADGYGTVINGNASDWGLFQQQATGEWLGQELVVNSGFDSGLTGWTVLEGGNAQVLTGTSSINIVTGGDLAAVQQSVLLSGSTFRATADVGAVSIGTLALNNDGGGGDFDLSQTSLNTWEFVAVGTGIDARRKTSAGAANGFINSVSVKEVLNVA